MPGWNYTRKAYYSITINTRNKGNVFGKIVDGAMNLNALGKIADEYAKDIPDHFSHVILHEHVIMPDHVHLLLEINKSHRGKTQQCCVSGNSGYNISKDKVERCYSHSMTQHCCVSPSNEKNLPNQKISNTFYIQKSGSIPVIIRSYKSICSREIHKLMGQEFFKWQTSFYDQVIFDEQYFQNTLSYIRNNPKKYHLKPKPLSADWRTGVDFLVK